MIEIDKDYYLNFKFLDGNYFHKDSVGFLTEIYVLENQKFAIFDGSPHNFGKECPNLNLNLECQLRFTWNQRR